ncbi:MAG: phosphate ABC transporter permease subunit PstC [Solirubrobacterales bacterium 70-9]|nr:MAG: phosphate ABC transporter permease subunit PstC [Solirubrobacterales bacterium 70-9]
MLRYGLTALAAAVLVLLAYFFIKLAAESKLVFEQEGILGFVFSNNWDVPNEIYGALPLVVGTLITSTLALVIGVPIAVGVAVFLTELCPRRLRGSLTILVDLLAAVPSVVYGLWAFYYLIPKLKPAEQWFADTFHFIPFVAIDSVPGPNYFIAGLVLAIMLLPIVSAISREVLSTVPSDLKEASLALGSTRWEMIRTSMLPYARRGITGAAMLGLGRAIGETIAVTIVIGDNPILGHSIFGQGYTLAAVIANEFNEAAANPVHKAALIGAGLVLFVLTLIVNSIARLVVMRSERQSGVPIVAQGGVA